MKVRPVWQVNRESCVAWKSVTETWIEIHHAHQTQRLLSHFHKKMGQMLGGGCGGTVTRSLLHTLRQQLVWGPCVHVSLSE